MKSRVQERGSLVVRIAKPFANEIGLDITAKNRLRLDVGPHQDRKSADFSFGRNSPHGQADSR